MLLYYVIHIDDSFAAHYYFSEDRIGILPSRFLFRMTYYKNLQTYLADGRLYAKNSQYVQAGYRISYDDIVNRRGSANFETPCGSNVNDFVPFYFSPSTGMAYAIHKGKVLLKDPDGKTLRCASMNDVAYIVVAPETLFISGRDFWFTDIACNSAQIPQYNRNSAEFETHIDWALFDDNSKMGKIPEIGYEGVCMYQQDRDQPVEHQMRGKKRMAEFMIKDYLQMSEVCCIILKDQSHLPEVQGWIDASGLQISVYQKPNCFF